MFKSKLFKIRQKSLKFFNLENLGYTVLLNLEIACYQDELNSITNYSKTIDFHHLILATVDNYH